MMFSKATFIPTLWLLSFLGSFFLFSVSDALQTASVVTMVASLLGYVASTGQFTFKVTKLTMLVGALWGLAAISVACSGVPFVSLTYFFFFSALPLTFYLFSFTQNASVLFRPMSWIILVFGIGAIIQFYFMPDMLKYGGTHWPLADNNSLAVILAVGALLFIGEALRGGTYTYHHIAAAVVTFAGVMTTGGAAVFIGFLLVLAVFTFMSKPITRKPVVVFMGGVILLMLLMYTSDLSAYHFLSSWGYTTDLFLSNKLSETNDFSGSRLIIWQSAFEMFKQNPLIGTGIGTFFLYYPAFRSVNDNSAGFMVHNDFIQISAEMGLMAPLIALGMIGFMIFLTIKQVRKTQNADERLNILIPFSAFGLMIGHSLVNFNLYVLPTLMMMGLFLAAWNVQIGQKQIKLAGTKTIREGICFVAVMVMLVPLWGCYLSEYYTARASDELADGNIKGFSDNLNMADAWGAGLNGRTVLMAAQFSAATNQNERALALLDRAQYLNPQLASIHVERARIFSIDDPQKGIDEAQKALQMDYGLLSARVVIAENLERLGKLDEAYDILKAGVTGYLRSRNPTAYLQMMATKSLERADMETNKDVLNRLRNLSVMKKSE